MIARIFYNVFLFFIPFAAYWLYWRFIGAQEEREKKAHPWAILIATGLGLVALSFVVWSLPESDTRGGVYGPPHLENGQVVPGRVQPQ